MTDIIVILPKVFIENKNEHYDVIDKYNIILSKYQCFVKSKHEYHPAKTKPIIIQKRHAHTFIKKKEPSKLLMGVMNVINDSNYQRVLNRIKSLTSSIEISEVINTIVKASTRDTIYVKIHIKLIDDLMKVNKDETAKIIETLQNFVDSFTNEKEWMQLTSSEISEGYLEFCDKRKTKATIVSKNLLLLELIGNFNIKIDILKYVKDLEHDLSELLNENNQHGATVVITMLTDIARYNTVYVKSINLSNLFSMIHSKKNKFILEDLAKFVNQNGDAYDRVFSKPSIKVVGGMYGSLKDVSC